MGLAVIVFFAVIAFVLIAMGIRVYNGLVSLKYQVDRAWANIDVILKQRFDEIPQLVQIIEQYVGHEKATIQRVMDARAQYGAARTTNQKVSAAQEMSVALRGVVAIGEGYPELRSNTNFVQLQSRLSSLEDSLADRRELFNESVTNFNTRIEQIPDVFFARVLGYSRLDLFRVSAHEKTMPNLKMNLG